MKRSTAYFGFALAFLTGVAWQTAQLPKWSSAEGKGGVSILNGDCDGNGVREVTDAVYLLGWLYLGGPEPVEIPQGVTCQAPPPPLDIHCSQNQQGIQISWENPIAYDAIEIKKNGQDQAVLIAKETGFLDPQFQAGEVIDYSIRGRLAGVVSAPSSCSVSIPPPPVLGQCLVASNQSTCYGASGTTIDCSLPPAKGQDAFYHRGCAVDGRFVDHGDGTVTDRCTGLMWATKLFDTNGDFEITETDRMQWIDAIKYVENLSYSGHDDWRLPNVEELMTIIDFGGNTPGPYQPFEPLGLGGTWLWSSTSDIYGRGAWAVGTFGSTENLTINASVDAVLLGIPKNVASYFAAVRDG